MHTLKNCTCISVNPNQSIVALGFDLNSDTLKLYFSEIKIFDLYFWQVDKIIIDVNSSTNGH